MRKSTLFISAALTTFMLAVMFGVVSAYQNIVRSAPPVVAQVQPTAVEVASAPIPVQALPITPQEAAALASQVISRTDLFSAEITQFNGVDVYLVTFSSGDLVYIGFDGQILSISKLAVTVINQPVVNRGGNNGNQTVIPVTNNSSSNGEGEHEEEHDDD